MEVFNDVIPFNLDMNWTQNDTFTFLNNEIIVWLSEACEEGMDLDLYDGNLIIKYTPTSEVLSTISTSTGEMIFTRNVITFNKPDLSLKVSDYYYQLKLINKTDSAIIGTLFEGKFKVKN